MDKTSKKVMDLALTVTGGQTIKFPPGMYTLTEELMYIKIVTPGRVHCYPFDNLVSFSYKEVQNG